MAPPMEFELQQSRGQPFRDVLRRRLCDLDLCRSSRHYVEVCRSILWIDTILH